MNNNQKLTAAVQKVTGQTKVQAEESIQAVLTSVKNLAIEDGKVTVQGYGTFSNKLRAEREGRNPMTGATITIEAKEVFSFKASK
jgi:DNA-binding protein HU-beta